MLDFTGREKKRMLIGVFIVLLLLQPLLVGASTEQHGAHVHGIASMNMAVEGDKIHLEFKSPAANIVGFEYEAKTEEEKEAVHQAIDQLTKAEEIFVFNKKAACRSVQAELKEDHDEHHHHQDAHKHEKEHEGEEHEVHSDIEVHYLFMCASVGKLQSIQVNLFDKFQGLEEINVQLLLPGKQSFAELTAKSNRIDF